MLLTFILAGIERGVNHVITHSLDTQSHLALLTGKALHVILLKPNIELNLVFEESGVRFEPVLQDIFEPQGGYKPRNDGTLTLVDLTDFIDFIQSPLQTITTIYHGDIKTLEQFHALCQSFDFSMLSEKFNDLSHGLSEIVHPLLLHLKK